MIRAVANILFEVFHVSADESFLMLLSFASLLFQSSSPAGTASTTETSISIAYCLLKRWLLVMKSSYNEQKFLLML